MSDLSIALLGGAGAMLGWGTADFLAKRTIDVIGDLRTLFWGQVVGVGALLALALTRSSHFAYGGAGWLALIGFGLVSGWSYLLLYRGFGRGQISVLSPIFAAYAGVAALISTVAFNEPLPTLARYGLPVCFLGILLMATDLRDLRANRERRRGGVPEVLGAMLIFAGWLVLWDRFLATKDWVPATLLMRAIACIGLVAFALAARQALRVTDRSLWPFLIGIGMCDVGAYSSLSYGFSHTDLGSIVALLSGAFSLPTLVLARLFLKERLRLAQGIAAVLILSGVALVAVS